MSIVRGDTFTVSIDVYGDRFRNALSEEKVVLPANIPAQSGKSRSSPALKSAAFR